MKIKDLIAKTIGVRINDALDLRGVKQKELAKYLGVTDNTISYFCSGSRVPNAEQIIEIARFLDVSIDYLYGETVAPTTDKASKELCATLGLSEDAVEHLRNGGEYREVINFLFEQNSWGIARDKLLKKEIRLGESNSILRNLREFLELESSHEDLFVLVKEDGKAVISSSTEERLIVWHTNIKNAKIFNSLAEILREKNISKVNHLLKTSPRSIIKKIQTKEPTDETNT